MGEVLVMEEAVEVVGTIHRSEFLVVLEEMGQLMQGIRAQELVEEVEEFQIQPRLGILLNMGELVDMEQMGLVEVRGLVLSLSHGNGGINL